ncbi:MAG: hypothetical protein JEZ09_07885 [Salinivirgaceae bacterium]|nr:hypothetical protein [Salinivirgaceae bacterium]
MLRISLLLIVFIFNINLFGQGFGFGYLYNYSISNYKEIASDFYSQKGTAMCHNGFVRYHNDDGWNAIQMQVGYKKEKVSFTNDSEYIALSEGANANYNISDSINIKSIRFQLIDHIQIGDIGTDVDEQLLSINGGLYYEYVTNIERFDDRYKIDKAVFSSCFGFMVGFEYRVGLFTFGIRYENSLSDLLNRDYINNLIPQLNDASELRGLRMDPAYLTFYMGINFDFW